MENYTIDVLRNYAPVDGVDISCSPEIWDGGQIVENLSQAIQDNIMSIRTDNNATDYFSLKIPVQGVRFLTSPNWSSEYEINPTQGSLLIAQPVGNQEGLGILGFCYVPYHFVYDIKYPVLAIIQNNGEIFQFPMAVVIEGNEPRNPLNGTAVSDSSPDLCNYENTNMNISVVDSNSNQIDANISYECLGETCNIGQTSSGSLSASFPQCDNGYVIASADGYTTGRTEFSTTQSGSLNMILEKSYNLPVDLQLNGVNYGGNATITFASSSGSSSQTIVYPQQTNVSLSEGYYTVQAYIYQNSSVNVGATTTQQCVNVASSGIAGALGLTQQQCFNVVIPAQIISSALSGGGQSDFFALESNLNNSKSVVVNVPSLPPPTSLEQIQENYILFNSNNLTINLN